MMKKLFFVGLMLINVAVFAQTQGQPKVPAFRSNPTLPQLQLLKIDSSYITKESLNKDQDVMIMYFSPKCDHCIQQWKEMTARMDELKEFQIVMATYQPFEEMVEFYKNYQLNTYKNILIGRDIKFALPPFYVMNTLPYFALYDKKGNLITTFEGNVKVDTLIGSFKKTR